MEARMLHQLCTWLAIQLILIGTLVGALHDLHISVPRAIPVGGVAILHCAWTLDPDEALYAVKWYRGGSEFYRFIPKELPHTTVFPVEGINVDISHSDAHRVRLVRVLRGLSGRFRCEVSADAPSFHTEVRAAHMQVVTLPLSGPRMGARRRAAQPGRTLRVVCEAAPSDPAPNITWFLNGEKVKGGEIMHEVDEEIQDWDWGATTFAPKISSREERPSGSLEFSGFGEKDLDFPKQYSESSQDLAGEAEYDPDVGMSNRRVFQNLPSHLGSSQTNHRLKSDVKMHVSREYLGSSQLLQAQSSKVPKNVMKPSNVSRTIGFELRRHRRNIKHKNTIRYLTAYSKASKCRRRNNDSDNLDVIQTLGFKSDCTKNKNNIIKRADIIGKGSGERNPRTNNSLRPLYASYFRRRRSAVKVEDSTPSPEKTGVPLLPSVSFLTMVVPSAAFARGPLRVSCVANIFSLFEARAEMTFEEEDPLMASVLEARNQCSGPVRRARWSYLLVFMLTVLRLFWFFAEHL